MTFASPVAPTQVAVQAALKSFVASILPGVVMVAGQQNRVAEPRSPDFIVMTPIRFERLRTNVTSYQDASFMGSIAGTTLTISDILSGGVGIGTTIYGVGVIGGTRIVAVGNLPGVWSVTPAQTVSLEKMGGGRKTWEQGAELTVQLDFHSAATSDAGDMAQTFTTMFRSDYAFDQFAQQTPDTGVRPLHADDARQMPFINENQQYEWRWIVEARLQVNDVVVLPMEFADSLVVDVISVDATYPP